MTITSINYKLHFGERLNEALVWEIILCLNFLGSEVCSNALRAKLWLCRDEGVEGSRGWVDTE